MPDVQVKMSVIMAVYNAELYLHEAIDSVLKQSFRDFELICVNDGSTDTSLLILEEYASHDCRVSVYNISHSGSPAITRNYGVDRSIGEYVFFLDADDYLSLDVLQKMYDRAKETGADVVLPDLCYVSTKAKDRTTIGLKGNRNIVLTNRQAVVLSMDWTIHACGFWRGSLVRSLRFEEFGMNSDEYSSRVKFFNCNKIVFCEGTYFYRYNELSITKGFSVKMYDRPYTGYRLALFLEQNGFDNKFVGNAYIAILKEIAFLSYLLIAKGKELNAVDREIAESKLKAVYDIINKKKLRKYLSIENGNEKYAWMISTILNLSLLKNGLQLIHFMISMKNAKLRIHH
jgi:glycosyltransferase involved in cell wall biosynthesis